MPGASEPELDLAAFKKWLDSGAGAFTEYDCRLLLAELVRLRGENHRLEQGMHDMSMDLATLQTILKAKQEWIANRVLADEKDRDWDDPSFT